MRSRRRLAALVLSAPLLLAACGDGNAEREDLVTSLTEVAEISSSEANCVADVIYAEGLFTEDELNNAAADPASVDGFQDTFNAALADCVN